MPGPLTLRNKWYYPIVKDKSNTFSSAMGDLKGLLDKEGIDINSEIASDSASNTNDELSPTHLPTLDGTIIVTDEKESGSIDIDDYISDIDDDQFDTMDFIHSKKELEEKVAAITEPEHIDQYTQQETENALIEKLKTNLYFKLSEQVEKSVNELKIKLLESMKNEIDDFFKK